MRLINKEEDLYKYLKLNYFPDLVKARKRMSKWDCYSIDNKYRIELKCRTKHYNTLLLEKMKYDAMIKTCSEHRDTPLYICSTPKNVYCFNLYTVEPEWEVNYKNPATTHFNNRRKVAKEVAYLNVIDATVL